MSDENWPAPTPRDEMLARVASRGSRIRAVRGAVNALVILSVVGASAFGVSGVISGLGDGGKEVDNIAMVPPPPDGTEPVGDPTVSSGSTDPESGGTGTTGDPTGEATDSGSGTTGAPGTSALPGGSGTTGATTGTGAGGRGSSTDGSTSTTAAGRPTTTAPTTTGRPTTTTEPATTSTTAVPAPRVGNMRTKVDGGVPTGLALCNDPSTVLAVDIEGAERARLTWNRAGQSRSAEMTAGASEWSAPIPEIDEMAADVPVIVTVEATGPGGTTRTSTTIPVADCRPLPSAPSDQGS